MYRRLTPQGKIFLQTDRKAYWDYLCGNLPSLFEWTNIEVDWPEPPEFRSRREILSRKQGLQIYRGQGVRRDGVSPEEFDRLVGSMQQPTFKIEEEDF